MKKRFCLIIDDNLSRVESTIDNVRLYGEKNGMIVEFIKFNPSERRFQSKKDGSILVESLKSYIHEELLNQRIDLIACDYQLDKSLSGLDIVNIIREKRKTLLFLYSGRVEKIVKDILDANKEENDNRTILKSISILIKKGIAEFIENDMNKLEQALIRNLNKTPNLDELFENKLSECHKDLIFKSIYPRFKDKTISEILSIINKESEESENFKTELVSQLIDFMVKLN